MSSLFSTSWRFFWWYICRSITVIRRRTRSFCRTWVSYCWRRKNRGAAQKSRSKKLGHIKGLHQDLSYLSKEVENVSNSVKTTVRINARIKKKLNQLKRIESLMITSPHNAVVLFEKLLQQKQYRKEKRRKRIKIPATKLACKWKRGLIILLNW